MAKKSFMDAGNPAMQFISVPEEKPAEQKPAPKPSEAPKAPKAPKKSPAAAAALDIKPRDPELKSKRAQLLMTPSLHERVTKKAASLNMSFNELVNQVLDKYVN